GGPAAVAAQAAAPSALLAPLPGWRPSLRPMFNDPGRRGSRVILRRILQAIRHTPRGETIRIATYSLDRPEVTYALRQARRRGAHVQVIVNKRTSSGLVFALQRAFGKNPHRANFVVTCPGRCRGPGDGGNQHIKIASFTRTGGARDVIIGSSGNLTSKATYRQWNDSWAIAYDPKVFNAWVGFFDQMKIQRQRGPRGFLTTSQPGVKHAYSLWLQRTPATASAVQAPVARAGHDPVVQRINDVGCRTRRGYGTADGRTIVRITEYAVFKSRGVRVANAIAGLKRRGCDVMVIGSVFSRPVIGILRRAGVPLRMGDWRFANRNPAEEDGLSGWGPRFYVHFKEMAVNGSFRGQPTKSVWTGSENWSPISFANEEVVVRFTDPAYYTAYTRQFRNLWRGRATHRPGIDPTGGPPR
ncbi:phospholipase D-like domain-containing protein, partial [Nocardioides sp. CER28]